MIPLPQTWTSAQRARFAPLMALMDTDGLINAFPVVHVSGTNGKGSLCAAISQICREANLKTGLFISPHLYVETERICVNGEQIDQLSMNRLMDEAFAKAPEAKLFENYFYAAVRWFEEQQVDIAVMETGIGGTMDATNLLQSVLTVTGTIGLDHQDTLGHTIGQIAAQKAGIAKPGVPAVLSPCADEVARQTYLDTCRALGAQVHDLSAAKIECVSQGLTQCLSGEMDGFTLPPTQIALLGDFQGNNLFTAAYVAHLLAEQGFPVTPEAICRGLENTRWPGRLEWRAGTPPLLIDGAHNREGAQALVRAVNSLAPGRPIVLVTAMLGDKNIEDVAAELRPMAEQIVTTQVDSFRALEAQALADIYGEKALACADPVQALALARRLCPENGLIVAAGSLYLPAALELNKA
ncbi:MAG: hypothetical protein IJP30_04885 [Clostridia bacterium]|nr:hypothetical protein [Clostridia bacterium]